MSPTPWSWNKPPLPAAYSVPGYQFPISRDKIWSRAPWGVEPLFGLASHLQPGFSDILFACQASLPSNDCGHSFSLQAVREAARLLRFQRPTIAARLARPTLDHGEPAAKDSRLIYEAVSTEEDIESWVDQIIVDRSATAEHAGSLQEAMDLVMRDVGRGFDSPPSTLFHLHVIITPDSASIGLIARGAHVLTDAFGLTASVNQLIANIATNLGNDRRHELPWGEEVQRLVGSAVDFAKITWSADEAQRDNKMLNTAISIAKEVKVTNGLPIPKPLATRTTTSVFVRTFTGDVLRNLITAARGKNCTLYPTLFAAMIISIFRVNTPSSLDGLAVPVLFTPANLRHKGILDRDNDVLSALSYNTIVARDLGRFVSDSSSLDGLWTIAQEIGFQLKEQEDDIRRSAIWMDQFIANISSTMEAGAKARGGSLPTTTTPRVSSLGILDRYLAHRHELLAGGILEVSHPCITVCVSYASPLFGYMIGLHAFTWMDTFYMCFSFPEAYMGTLKEQKEDRKVGSVWAWSEEFIGLLRFVSRSTEG